MGGASRICGSGQVLGDPDRQEGGDVSDAEAVLLAVPGGAIEAALDNVQGLDGKTVIDATNSSARTVLPGP